MYQDGVIQVSDVAYKFSGQDTTVVSFKMTKDGAPLDKVENLNIYFAPYANGKFQFDPVADRLSLKGKVACDGGNCTSTLVDAKVPNVGKTDGVIAIYGYDEQVGSLPVRVKQVKYPFAAILKTGKGVDYVSAANNAGCEKCHSAPYLKHGNIYGEVGKDPTTDFVVCKVCHLDNGVGGHFEWQLTADDPKAGAEYLAQGDAAKLTPEQEAKYGYKTALMNDVHMSHAMEFPYPQSMSNCATCHEGKLDKVLADANMKYDTCRSCHPQTGTVGPTPEGATAPTYDTTKLALKTIMPAAIHGAMDLATTDCTTCHGEGKSAKPFNQIHTGYDKNIYATAGVKYSDVISVTIDSASFTNNVLDIQFSSHGTAEGLDSTAITPTLMVGLYGWDTKDFILGPHERSVDDNGDGKVDSKDQRNLEAVVGEEHPRIKTVSAAGGKWEVTVDLTAWAAMLTDGSVKRVEIGVLPALANADGNLVALNAPSRTFDLGANAFADGFYSPIVKVADGCNTCHDALGTTFHTPDRGGNVVVCRMCHITKAGGSHLEMQSRSIDSYVHAIHSGQQFDVGTIDFKDPVQAEEYKLGTELPFPRHGMDCLSCHVDGAFNVPDQTKSLPGLLSASAENKTMDRKIGAVPAMVTGPASRACGSCHRATMINEDNAAELVAFNQHVKQGGYMVDAGKDPTTTLMDLINQIMALFK